MLWREKPLVSSALRLVSHICPSCRFRIFTPVASLQHDLNLFDSAKLLVGPLPIAHSKLIVGDIAPGIWASLDRWGRHYVAPRGKVLVLVLVVKVVLQI
jgi:hypothetical protein